MIIHFLSARSVSRFCDIGPLCNVLCGGVNRILRPCLYSSPCVLTGPCRIYNLLRDAQLISNPFRSVIRHEMSRWCQFTMARNSNINVSFSTPWVGDILNNIDWFCSDDRLLSIFGWFQQPNEKLIAKLNYLLLVERI